jgi:N-acetylglucosaminyl-diphospho-decaprenol L-rhamnosyltransferase
VLPPQQAPRLLGTPAGIRASNKSMIAVIIVTYNSRDHIGRCLESLQASGAEIVVVDNASQDGTAELVRQAYPAVKLIRAPRNLGFAAAANLGVRNSSGTTLLFLNPDVVCRGPLGTLEQALNSSPETVAVAPRLVDAEGRTQVGFNVRRLPTPAALIFEILLLNRLFPRNPVNRKYRCLDFDYERAGEVEQPAGACLLVRRASFEACGSFDERFFPLWFEDVDLCLRLRRGGGKILYCPLLSFRHAGAHSIPSLTFSERQVYWYRNLLYYVQKHFPRKTGVAIRAVLLCGVALRMIAELPGLLGISKTRTTARGERMWAYLKAAKLSFLGWR